MPTFLIVLAILALLFVCFCLWVRSKVRRGVAWVKVTMLEAALKELRQKAEKPDAEPELPALIERVDAALAKAKAAHAKGDTSGVAEAADTILAELLQRVSDQAKKEVDAEGKGTVVIDVTPNEPVTRTSCDAGIEDKPVLALPKPADPTDPANPPAGQ